MRKFTEDGPDYSQLTTILVNSKIATTNNALYQCIAGIIAGIRKFQELVLGRLNNITVVQDAQGNIPAETLLGNGEGPPGPVQLIRCGAGIAFLNDTLVASGTGINQLTGDVTAGPGSGSQTATIAADAVTYAKMQNVSAASRILGRGSAAGAGNVEELTPGTNIIAATTINLLSDIYTPGLTNVANLDASTAYSCQYMRVGNVVTVTGKVDIDPTTPATLTQLGIALPIASNFANIGECAGVAFASGIAGQGAAILADVTNDRAQLEYIAGDVTNQPMYFTFSYRII